jgi:glycosyltransferase involved in cell wall biosynthesis
MTYLGNARSTKGFQYLPFVFHALSDKLKNKLWRAEVQSNVMFTHDLESNVALSLLKKLPVQIYENELSINEYNELLLRSSIVILPYQLLFYHAQTSGVLCEAMSAGKPVIVPRGTWLSQQIQGKKVGVKFCPGDRVSLLEATQTAMNNIDELSESAEQQAKEWSNYHSPENFMKYLLAVTRGGLREL